MNNKFKKFLIREGFATGGGTTVFIVSFGDGRLSYGGRGDEKLIGIFPDHDSATEAGMKAEQEAGLDPDRSEDHYGAMIDEVDISELNDYLRDFGIIK